MSPFNIFSKYLEHESAFFQQLLKVRNVLILAFKPNIAFLHWALKFIEFLCMRFCPNIARSVGKCKYVLDYARITSL